MKTLQSINNRINLLTQEIQKWQASDVQAPTAIERDVVLVQVQHLYQELLDVEVVAPSALLDNEPELEVEFVYDDEVDEDLDVESDELENDSELEDEVAVFNCSGNEVFTCKNSEPQEEPLSALIDTIETEIEMNEQQSESNKERCDCKDDEVDSDDSDSGAVELMASVYNFKKSASDPEVGNKEGCLIDGEFDDNGNSDADFKDECEPCKQEEDVDILGYKVTVHDKIRFVNDLFTRDLKFFDDEIAKFEAMNNFDQALIYIGEHYNWAADSDSAEKFIAILENKFN